MRLHQVADNHQVSLRTVGDWLDAEGATTLDVSPQRIVEQFTAAYIWPFADQVAYTRHRMAQLSWADAVTAAGIPEQYIDTQAMARDWFSTDVRRLESGTWDRIEVFHRH